MSPERSPDEGVAPRPDENECAICPNCGNRAVEVKVLTEGRFPNIVRRRNPHFPGESYHGLVCAVCGWYR